MSLKPGARIEIHEERFSSAEAEAATLVSQVTQRDWLRRGLIQPGRNGGRTSFKGLDLAFLVILRELTHHQMFVAAAAEIAALAAPLVMTFAEWASTAPEDAPFVGLHGSKVCRFLVVPHDGDAARCDAPAEWFARQDAEGKSASALILDCRALGQELAQRLPRPLIRVERSMAE